MTLIPSVKKRKKKIHRGKKKLQGLVLEPAKKKRRLAPFRYLRRTKEGSPAC